MEVWQGTKLVYCEPSDFWGKYAYGRDQVIFVLENWATLEEGKWPRDPREVGYSETPQELKGQKFRTSQRFRKAVAPFQTAADIWAEIDFRLKKCGQDGEWLLDYFALGKDLEAIARSAGVDLYEVNKRTSRALKFVSGYKRKRRPYGQWYQRNYTAAPATSQTFVLHA